MKKAGPISLSVVLATALTACGSPTEQNQAASQNVLPAPSHPTSNMPVGDNVAVANATTSETQPVESTRPTQPRRTPPAPKAEPAPRPAPQDDPHAGHDMSAMNHQ